MKYRFGLPVALVAAGTLFVACGDESTSELVKAESYASSEDLPKCDNSYKGYFAVIPSKSEVYVCSETEKDGAKAWNWTAVGGSAPVVATPELDCKAEELNDKSGFKLVCNGDSLAVIKNGAKGEKGSDADVPETEPAVTDPAAPEKDPAVTDPDKPDPPSAEPEIIPGDTDGNGSVNCTDLIAMKKELLYSDSKHDITPFDLNKDQKINIVDFILLKNVISSGSR